jgi:Domain of unknown function (DUF4142)
MANTRARTISATVCVTRAGRSVSLECAGRHTIRLVLDLDFRAPNRVAHRLGAFLNPWVRPVIVNACSPVPMWVWVSGGCCGGRLPPTVAQANQRLAALARAKQMTPPSSMDTLHTQVYQQLQNTRGRNFDKLYMDGQVQDHQTVVQVFQNEAQNGTDPDVRAFAQQNLPMMQHHLEMAQRLDPRR